METITCTYLRNHLADAINQVNEDHTPMLITGQKGKSAVLLSAEDWAAIEETLYLMQSPKNAERLQQAVNQLHSGEDKEGQLTE